MYTVVNLTMSDGIDDTGMADWTMEDVSASILSIGSMAALALLLVVALPPPL